MEMGRREVRVTPDERISVLETLLAKVRRSAADRGLALPVELPPKGRREVASAQEPITQDPSTMLDAAEPAPDPDDEPRALMASGPGSSRDEAHSPPTQSNGSPPARVKLTAFDEPATEERTAVSVVPSHIAIAAAAAATGGLVRFEGAFQEEETSVGDPDEIEAMALADAHDAEQGRDALDGADADGPATLPPPPSRAAPSVPPPVLIRSERPSIPLGLEDLDAEYGPDPRSAAPPPPVTAQSAVSAPSATPPAPAPVRQPTPPPPAFVAPPALVPPPSRLQPPPHAAPAPLPPPPAFVAAPASVSTPDTSPPSLDREVAAAEVYLDVADVDVIELDEADVLQSVPPETVLGASAESFVPEEETSGGADASMFERPTRVSDPAGYFADEEIADPETLPPARRSAGPAVSPPEDVEPAPASQRKPRELDRPLDDALDGVEEEAPESGEVESKRIPTSRARSPEAVEAVSSAEESMLDEPATPRPAVDVTAEVRALGSVDVVDRPAPPLVPVTVAVGSRPYTPRTFGQLLDEALGLGEPPRSH